MALTITRSGDWQHLAGNRRVANITVAFDSSYPTGGESLIASDVGMRVIERVEAQANNGYTFEYDYTNSLLKAYRDTSQGILFTSSTVTGNVGTGLDTLEVYTMPASTITATNEGVEILAWGRTAANGALKMPVLYFGTAAVVSPTTLAANAGRWVLKGTVLRTGAAAQEAWGEAVIYGATNTIVASSSSLVQDFTGPIAVHVRGESTSNDDIQQYGMLVKKIVPVGTGATGFEVQPSADLSGLTNVRVRVTGY